MSFSFQLYSSRNVASQEAFLSNLAELAQNTCITSFHASCSTTIPVAEHLHHFGFAKTQKITDRDTVLTFRNTLDNLAS